MADCKERRILLRKSSDGKLSSPYQDLCLSVDMAATSLNGTVEDETLLLKNTFSEGTQLPVINESFINQLKSGMDDSHLFPVFCTKTSVQKRNTANDTINSQNTSWTKQTFTKKTSDKSRTKELELSSSSLDSTLNTSGNKVREVTNINPFKKPRDKKVKTSFALDTTQEENASFEEEQQKYKQIESKINPFKKNLKRKKFSVRFEKTFDSSNESIQETETPVKEISISTNNDSVSNANKKGVSQNPFKRSNKRKRYSIVGKLDTSSGSSDKQSETVNIQRSETIFTPHNLQVTKENAKHNPFRKVTSRRFSFNATLDTSDVANVNESDINENRMNTEIQQFYQPNLLHSGAIQEDLSMKNDENLEREINASVQKCSEFNESIVSQNDSIKIKERSQEITNNMENFAMYTITTIAEIDSREEPMTEISTESVQIPSIETSKVSENNSEGILQFVEIERAVSQNVDNSELLPNNETVSCTLLSSDINLENLVEAKVGDKIEDFKENDAPAASNENVLTSPDQRCPLDEVVLNNILFPPISNTTLNSVHTVTEERNNSLPTNSEIDNIGQISLKSSERLVEKEHTIESNHIKLSTISEEESARQSKQSHGTLSDDVENLSVCIETAEVHSFEEFESGSCTEPQDQKVECGSNEAREKNTEEISQIMEVVTSASQNIDKDELLTEGTESYNSLGSQINSENKAEPNDANERDENGIFIEAEAQTGSNGNVLVLPGVGMATTLLNGSVEDETLLLKNTFSEVTSLPVINEPLMNQLKSGMDDSQVFPIFCTKPSAKKGNTANDSINSQNSNSTNQTFTKKPSDQSRTKEHELSSSSLDSTLNTSGNKVHEIINTNPFKKTIDKKVKTSFALDTTQEENVSFEEEQQTCKQMESKINPFKKNLQRNKISVRFEKTFDSSNEISQVTDTRPVEELSVNNDSLTDEYKDRVSQNPFKRLIKRKRYSIDGKLHTSSVNDTYINVKGVEDNTGIQQLNQPNLSTSMEIQEDLVMENYENVEAEINVSFQKCSEFNESLVSRNDSIKFKKLSQENLPMYTRTTSAEIHSRDEPMTEISTESSQILSIEAAEFSDDSSEEILQFVEIGTAASQNVDKTEIEDDAEAASNENILTSPVERCKRDEVLLNNILSTPISNTTLNSARGVTEEGNASLPTNSEICNSGQMSPESSERQVERILLEKEHNIESNHKKTSNITEETAPQSKQLHVTLSDNVENLSVFAVTTITEIHSCKESESESCTRSENQKVGCGRIEVKGNNDEELSQNMAIGKPASQNFDKNELLTKETESCISLALQVNSENKAESNDANEKQIHKEAEPQTGSNGNEPISPGIGMAATPLNVSVEDETLLLKNTFSEVTSLPVINKPFINQLKSGMDDRHVFPIFCTKPSAQEGNTANDAINSQNSSSINQTFTKKPSDQSRTKEHELSSSSLDSTLNTSGNKVHEIINTNPFKKTIDKKEKTSFALDTTQEENVSFEEKQQKCKQMESKINPFKKNLKRKKISVRFEKTFDSSNEISQVTDSRPVKEDSISVNNDSVTNGNKDRVNQNPFKMSNQNGRYSIMGKLDNSSAGSDKQSETVDVQRSVTSDASSVDGSKVNVKGIEDNTEIQQLNQSNLLTSVEIQEDLLMRNDEYVELEIVASAQKYSDNENLVSQNDPIKTKELSQENLAVCAITTSAEIHSRDEPMTEISTESTQFLSIEAAEFSENSSEEILQFVEIGSAASQNVDKSGLLPNNETGSCSSLSSDINLENRADADARDEVENSKKDDAQAASNETVPILPDERCPRDEVVIRSILTFPVSNTILNSVLAVSDERNNSLPSNSEIHKTGQISPESSERSVEKVLLEKEHTTVSSNHKKPSNISKEESARQNKQSHGTLSDDVENLSVCIVTTIAEVHSNKKSESGSCTELTEDQKVECGSNEARENNGEEISQIIVVAKSASQNVELLNKETESCNSLGSHVNSENMDEPNDANEREEKNIPKESKTQIGSNGNVPISPGKQHEANGIGLGNNLLLSSSSNAIIACASQFSEKKEIPKNVESKTGTHTMSMISETKNNSAQTIDNIHLLPTPRPRNVDDNDELAVEQSRVCSQTGNGHFLDECDLNKNSSKRLVQRKSSRIAGLSMNKSYEAINTSKNTSTKYRKASKNLKESNISPALMECQSKGNVDKEMNVSINVASNEASAINLNCKPDKKSVETNVSNGVQKVASRNEVSKITRQYESLKDMTSELINDKCNHDTGSTDNQAVDSNKQQLSDSGKTRKKNSRNISTVTAISKSNTERNKGVAISKRQTPLKDVNKIITVSSKHSSKEKEKPPDSFTAKGNNKQFGELSLSFDVSAIPNDKLISSKKRKYKSTPLVQRTSRSKRLSVNVLLQNENRKNTLDDDLSTVSASKHSKETKKIVKEKTLNSANDFEFAAPKFVSRKSSITAVKPRRSVTFRPHSSLIPSPDDSVNTKISSRRNNGRKFSIDVQTSLGEKSKNSMDRNSCKIVSTVVSSKHNHKKIERNSAAHNKTNKDISYETTLEVSEIAHQTPKHRKRLLFHSTPKNRITSLGTPSLARKRKRTNDNQETPRSSSSSLYSTTDTDALQSDSYTPTFSRTLRNSSSNANSNKNILSYNSHTCMASRMTAISAHQSNQDNSVSSAQSGTKTTSNGAVEPCNSDVLLEESSCFNRPPDDSFSISYSGENESVRARSVLEESATIVETQERRRSLRNGTMHMTLRSSRTTLQHSTLYSETQLSEITQTTVNESNLAPEKSLSLISKFSRNKKRKDSVFGNVEKKKVIPHNEPLPKLAKPAKWIKKELYTFLAKKLCTKYKLEKRYHCERLVLILHNAVTNTLMGHPELSLLTLKEELISYGICKTQLDYFTFLHRYTPLAFIKKIVPLGRAYDNGDFKYKKIAAYGTLE